MKIHIIFKLGFPMSLSVHIKSMAPWIILLAVSILLSVVARAVSINPAASHPLLVTSAVGLVG